MQLRNYNHLFLGLALLLTVGLAQPAEAQTVCVRDADCANNEFCEFAAGTCPKKNSGAQGSCVAKPEACIQIYDPVCGCDNKTYGNNCTRQQAGVSLKSTGECGGGAAAGSKPKDNDNPPRNLSSFLQSLR